MMTPSSPFPFAFDQATGTRFLGETSRNTQCYLGQASADWAIGQVPNGGYVVSIMLDAVLLHYAHRYQKHPVALNCFYLKKTMPGPVLVEIEDIKQSRKGYCVSRVVLRQAKHKSAALPTTVAEYDPRDYVDTVHGMFTMGNFEGENGITHFHRPAQPPSREPMVPHNYRFMGSFIDSQIHATLPPQGRELNGTIGEHSGVPELSQAMRFKDGRPIDFKSVPFWCDMFITPPALLGDAVTGGPVWCPTMQIEVQFKSVPRQGTREILAHFISPHIINGRFDLDGEIFDGDGHLLALTRHQCLVVPWDRNSSGTQRSRL